MRLKLCGLRRAEDIRFVNACPPDYAGFVFAESRRRVTAAEARELVAALTPGICPVGVFVNEPIDTLLFAAQTARLAILQLHGDEDADYIAAVRAHFPGEIWKAVRVRSAQDIRNADVLPVDMLLLDAFSPVAYGGTGTQADLALIAQNRPQKPFFLAGGLHSGNVLQATALVRPDGIDLSGGIETNGVKDAHKIAQLYELIKGEL